MKKVMFLLVACFSLFLQAQEKPKEENYEKVAQEKAKKVLAKLSLNDSKKEAKVTDILVAQYQELNKSQLEKEAAIAKIKAEITNKDAQSKAIEEKQKSAESNLEKLHKDFLKKLGKQLDKTEIETVKNEMTNGILKFTYDNYLEMLLNLTTEQKEYIYKSLAEARELAMDAGTSKEKHAWFAKYKGRINNYLSTQGYDLKKEGVEWQKRIAAKKTQN